MARDGINVRKGQKSPLDGELFYIKHLLVIREQITPFHASFAITETQLGFGHIKGKLNLSSYCQAALMILTLSTRQIGQPA